MNEALLQFLAQHREDAYLLLRTLTALDKPFLLRSDLVDAFDAFCAEQRDLCETALGAVIQCAQEAIIDAPLVCFACRPSIGRWEYLRFHLETVAVEEIDVAEFLAFAEHRAAPQVGPDAWPLEIDLRPFHRGFPFLKESRSIGHGVSFLNRKLSSELFVKLDNGDRSLLEFLQVHQHRGRTLMVNERIADTTTLRRALRTAEKYLAQQSADATWHDVGHRLQEIGFEIGWGNTAARMRETLHLLSDVLEAPDPNTLEEFLGRIPMIFTIVILTPHGFFGQANVLGKPDTGGQVVYILDQARALEQEMLRRTRDAGLDIEPQILIVTRLIPDADGTTCNQPREHVFGTQHATILRVPFRDHAGEIVPHWISRFEIWPYLERFTLEVEKEVLAELNGRPGLIIGNYSDGNLVATLLSRRLGVTQCNIAHALEKTKYLYSDLFWQDNEPRYHFSCQFTADLVAMNAADFIITSTYQEIAGTPNSVGQYESHSSFTMPGLYRVVHGVDVFDPKFNVVSPGADPDVYFPWSHADRRLTGLHDELRALVFGPECHSPSWGTFSDPDKPVIFTMARLDHIKNLTGLARWYGRHPRLRQLANLLIVGGHLDVANSTDAEERDQIEKMWAAIHEHNLAGHFRWVGFQTDRNFNGELYRYIADLHGVFVQPALFEAFGLSVIEAMSTGLPTFATRYGGPLEIIENGVSGFHIDPNHGDAVADALADFFDQSSADPHHWQRFSQAAIDRVEARYTWKRYAGRMMTLARVYGFWKYTTNLERQETRRYLDALYSTVLRNRIHVSFNGQ